MPTSQPKTNTWTLLYQQKSASQTPALTLLQHLLTFQLLRWPKDSLHTRAGATSPPLRKPAGSSVAQTQQVKSGQSSPGPHGTSASPSSDSRTPSVADNTVTNSLQNYQAYRTAFLMQLKPFIDLFISLLIPSHFSAKQPKSGCTSYQADELISPPVASHSRGCQSSPDSADTWWLSRI